MLPAFESLKNISRNRRTYAVGMLQAKAYRVLKRATGEALKPFGISPSEWALLGLLYEEQAVTPSEAAVTVGVEPPFITVMMRSLKALELLDEHKNVNDSRQKVLCLTAKGRRFVEDVEPQVRAKLLPLVKTSSARSLMGYLETLLVIVKNGKD